MALMTVMVHEGMALVYDSADVADITVSTPNDVMDITRPGDTAVRLELGQAHVDLHIDFLPGKRARWVEQEGQ